MDIIVPAASSSPMNPESKQNGGKISPPVVCDDVQQQQQNQPQQRPTRYINNSTLVGGVNKISNRSNPTSCTSKNKSLVRSHAVSEETSPPPPDGVGPTPTVSTMNNNKNGKLRQQSSQQSSSLESSLSIDNNVSSHEKNGSDDNDLLNFIVDTLNRNAKDRTLILRIESELIAFIKDPTQTAHNFPQMTSYQRMLVHRVSGYFHLDHNLDNSATCVVVTKTKGTRIPETRFRDYIEDQQQQDANKTVLKRDSSGPKKGEEQTQQGMNRMRGKSFEERSEDYNRARRRIFNSDQQHHDVYSWSSSTESNATNDPQGKHPRHFNRKSTTQNSSTLLKVESFETATINRSKSKPPVVNKSYSFGGYGATDGSNVVIGNSNNMSLNRFSKQDSSSSSSGLSPASSGYKSQSFQSSTENTMTTPNSSSSPQNNLAGQESATVLSVDGLPPSTAVTAAHSTHHQHCVLAAPVQPAPLSQQQYIFYPASTSSLGLMQGAPLQMQPQHTTTTTIQPPQQNPSQQENVVLWAVTDMNHVPPGSILIDPNSGQALKNNDGTMYHYDPHNPPKQVIPQPHSSELLMYQSTQPHMQQQPQLVNTPSGDAEHMTQWFTQMGIQQQPAQAVPQNQQWGGEEYYVTSPHPGQPPSASSYYTTGGPPILWDPSKISPGTLGLNQQYYPVPAHPPPPPPPPPSQQQHYVMAAPPGPTQQPQQQVVMQYSVPSSSATGAPYMSYMLQPYSPLVAAAAAAANYNLVQYGQQPSQAPRPILPNTVHQTPQQQMKLSKEFCYVPTSTTPTPVGSNGACLYSPFYGNAVAAAAAAHVQNHQQPGGHRFPGNPQMYPAQFIPRPGSSGFINNYRSKNPQQLRKNRVRNISSNNERSSSLTPQQQQQQQPPQQQQQQQSSDKNS